MAEIVINSILAALIAAFNLFLAFSRVSHYIEDKASIL
jgi:hypothetical protein